MAKLEGVICISKRDGDHKHKGEDESDYLFTILSQLLSDFKSDVRRVLNNE